MSIVLKELLREQELYRLRGEDKQRGRAYQRRRATRSNLKYARRPEGWREWLAALITRRTFAHKANVLPVWARPWVPRVADELRGPDGDDLRGRIKAVCGRGQYDALCRAYPVLGGVR